MVEDEKLAKFSWPLFGSNFASVFGDGVYRFGLNWFLVSAYGNAEVLGWLTGFGFFIYLIADLFVGAMLDRFNRKRILIFADLFGAISLLSLSWLLAPTNPQIWLLLLITAIVNMDVSFAFPAGRAILPDVIRTSRIPQFNAWISAGFSAGQALGPLFGGLLLHLRWIDLQTFMLVYGVMLLATAGLNALIKYRPAPYEEHGASFWRDLIDGYRYVIKNSALRQSMYLTVWTNFFFEGFIIAMPYLMQADYHGNSSDYATFLTLAAVVGIFGGIAMTRFPNLNSLNSLYLDYYVTGLLFIIGAFVQTMWYFGFLIVVHGLMRALFIIKINTIRQQASQTAYLGRVFGISFFATDLFAPIITIGIGYGVSSWHEWTVFALGSALILGIGGIQWLGVKFGEK
jgi:MFS family permease